MDSEPLVSIIMSTYNPDPSYLLESVASILNQTYSNIEFIIINDGSTIDVTNLIVSIKDSRIKYINLTNNVGITKCLNIALNYCSGKYIARMDDDDISLPDRIEKQVAYFEEIDSVNVLGTNVIDFGSLNKKFGVSLPKNHDSQQIYFLFGNYGLPHPTVMLKASFLKKHNITYNEKYKKSQDYGLWVECCNYTKLYCLEEKLLKYRHHEKQITTKNKDEQNYYANMVRLDQLEKFDDVTEDQKKLHLALCNYDFNYELKEVEAWKNTLIDLNNRRGIYNQTLFEEIVNHRWLIYCFIGLREKKNYYFLLCITKSFTKKEFVRILKKRFKFN